MKQLRKLSQYYVDLMMKLGLIRFSWLLASMLILCAMMVQMAVTLVLKGKIDPLDMLGSVFFGLLITPGAVYFLSVVVEQLEESRQHLSRFVDKLEQMRHRDLTLNQQLKENILHLNREISDRIKAEQAHLLAVEKLEEEMAQREQAQIKLSEQTELLQSFLNASPDLVYYRDENNTFSGCNRAMELLIGKSAKQLVGLTPIDVYPPEIAEKIVETDDKVFQHNVSLTYEQWLVYPDGRKACFELRKVPFYDRIGNRRGLMGFGRDITERKRYQDALENASREKTTFISTISHELRTPLNGIVGLSRILLDTQLNQEQLSYLKTIYVSAVTLGNIFNDVIEMDKLERRKVQLDNQPLEFAGFLSDLENLVGLLVQPKGLTLVMDVPPTLPFYVITDATRLRQILWNLLSNAVKFTEKGKIIIRIRREAETRLTFDIADTGCGIPVAEQDKIFAMYYQVKDRDGGRPATGTGIGLAVSRRLAKAMGGDITVQSVPGQGTCFTLTIEAPSTRNGSSNRQAPEVKGSLPALHVLLVEDIELNVVVARSVLEKLGNSVDVAMTGQQALDRFRPGDFDLVLLDIQLPDMSGLDIARELRQRYAGQTLPPLIALTANVLKNKSEYLSAGMDDVLSKPLSVPALIAMLTYYWGPGSSMETVMTESKKPLVHESLLDMVMLQQYMELVGPELIMQSVDLFEQTMPSYLASLESNMIARDDKGVCEQGHKIKGAAGAVGLSHLQQLAQQIQTPTLPAWQDNVQDWVDELKQEWRNDVEALRLWLADANKK